MLGHEAVGTVVEVGRAAKGVKVGQKDFPMSRINEAFERLEAGEARYRIILDADC